MAALSVPAIALSQQAGSEPPGSAQATDTLVDSRKQENASEAAAIRNRGAEGQLTAMRAIVRAHFRAIQRGNVAITNSEELPAIDAEQVALFLTMLGYDPSRLQSSGQASQIVRSATNVLFGSSRIADEMNVAPVVSLATLLRIEDAAAGDGYHSTAFFRVLQAVKGGPSVGSEIAVRQRSGKLEDGTISLVSTEFLPGMTGDYLLFVSPSVYKFRARNAAPSEQLYAQFLLPYSVRDGVAYATAPGQNSNAIPVSTLRAGG